MDRDRTLPIFQFTNAAAVATGAGRIRGNMQNNVNTSDLLRGELAGTFDTANQQLSFIYFCIFLYPTGDYHLY